MGLDDRIGVWRRSSLLLSYVVLTERPEGGQDLPTLGQLHQMEYSPSILSRTIGAGEGPRLMTQLHTIADVIDNFVLIF